MHRLSPKGDLPLADQLRPAIRVYPKPYGTEGSTITSGIRWPYGMQYAPDGALVVGNVWITESKGNAVILPHGKSTELRTFGQGLYGVQGVAVGPPQ
jgi:hypothetical protein